MIDVTLSNQYVGNLIEKIVIKINQYPESKGLASVVLTGSLGRDEGTFHLSDDGSKLVLDSDVELALVYKIGRKKSAEKIKRRLIADFDEEMNPMTISESRVKNGYNFNYSLVKPQYSSIFMYDFYNGSKTIWGKDFLAQESATYDKYEAKRIIANRIGELAYLEINTNGDNNSKILKQWEGKLLLAMGSAFCILENMYMPKYKSQRDYVVSQKSRVESIFGENFVADYDMAYLFLRKGEPNFGIQREKLREYVNNSKKLFREYEVYLPKINSFSRKLKYAVACVKTRANLNPFTCEEDIIDFLIYAFSSNNDSMPEIAQNWRNILY